MPGIRCAVANCLNSVGRTKSLGLSISYHRFPADPERCKEWKNRCGRISKANRKNLYICSEHFIQSDFERDLKAELLNLKPKLKLKPEGKYLAYYI